MIHVSACYNCSSYEASASALLVVPQENDQKELSRQSQQESDEKELLRQSQNSETPAEE